MNPVDWVLLGAIVVFAWSGWRQGFVAGALSFAGFLGGGLLGAYLAPRVVDGASWSGGARVIAVGFIVLACAALGQGLTSYLGRELREGITWKPARALDSVGGAALNVLALAVVAWIVASAAANLPDTGLTQQIRSSSVLVGLDSLVPDPVRNAFTGLRDLVGSSGFPRVFSGLGEVTGPEVAAPNSKLAKSKPIAAASKSVVKVVGSAPDCGTQVTGTGFVYAPERVLTNAHVVAGVDSPTVQLRGTGEVLPARVVEFDPQVDVAVLLVPGLEAPLLSFSKVDAESGDDAVIAGFPGGGRFTLSPARIRALLTARGEDIYGRAGIVRDVYSFLGEVRPGDSGGPLLTPQGAVYGVVFASSLGDKETGYALTAEQVAPIAEDGVRARRAVGVGTCQLRDAG